MTVSLSVGEEYAKKYVIVVVQETIYTTIVPVNNYRDFNYLQ